MAKDKTNALFPVAIAAFAGFHGVPLPSKMEHLQAAGWTRGFRKLLLNLEKLLHDSPSLLPTAFINMTSAYAARIKLQPRHSEFYARLCIVIWCFSFRWCALLRLDLYLAIPTVHEHVSWDNVPLLINFPFINSSQRFSINR